MSETLAFTGERYLPERGGEISYEHWHRYALARGLGAHRTVIDIACGEGYGAALLADVADSVIGVDISNTALAHARGRYAHCANLRFVRATCARLPFAEASFDLAISFETIEHIAEQGEFIAELARILRPDGLLLLSSPNKRLYSDGPGYHNEFHVHELYRNELESLLAEAFPHRSWFGQKLLFHSTIWPEDRSARGGEYLIGDSGKIASSDCPGAEPMYHLVACSCSPNVLPAVLTKLSLFSDATESVCREHSQQARRVVELDLLLIDRERIIAERDELLALRTRQMEASGKLIAERDRLLQARTAQIAQSDTLLKSYAAQIAERDDLLLARGTLLAEHDALLKSYAAQIAERDHLLLARDALLTERDALLKSYAAQIAERDDLLLARGALLTERDALLRSYAAQIAERDALLVRGAEQQAEQRRIIAERDALLARREEQIATLDRELARRAGVLWWLKSPWRFIRRGLGERC